MQKLICATIAVSILTTGCSTLAANTQTLKVACSEPDASIQINGGKPYQGTARLEARRNKPVSIACYKSGYFPSQKVISSSLSGTGVADLVGSFILVLPVLGLFTPGAWNLDETDVTLFMVKD
jgi:hypothetical protein